MTELSDLTHPAFARTPVHGYTSVYTGTAPLPPAILRSLVADAGARLWSNCEDVVAATQDTAMLVATSRGPRSLELPSDLIRVGTDSQSSRHAMDMEEGDVALFVRDTRA